MLENNIITIGLKLALNILIIIGAYVLGIWHGYHARQTDERRARDELVGGVG